MIYVLISTPKRVCDDVTLHYPFVSKMTPFNSLNQSLINNVFRSYPS